MSPGAEIQRDDQDREVELQFQPLFTWPLHLGGGSGPAAHNFLATSLRFLCLESRTLSFPSISWDSPRSQSLIVREPQVLQVRGQNIQTVDDRDTS